MPSVFTPYLPAFQLRRLATRAALPLAATEERTSGATLLVDVAGFTGLTDRFAARGPEGAEQLSDILNTYFGRMTDIIAQHGGDVVLFAGDAVLAVWPVQSNDLTAVTRLAAQCALALGRELHGFAAAEGVELRHRAAVGAGPLSHLEVGGERGRWHPLLAGDAIAQLGPTRKLARPGEIIASPEAWAQLHRVARAEVLDDGEARIEEIIAPAELPSAAAESLDAADDFVRAYVPGAVLQRLDAGHGEWLAEFRPVVVVFINIAGVEYGTAGTLERLQNVMLAVQKPLQHYDGTVYQFLMDDKGTSIVAAFGLPHHAQEHEAVRAVSAAQSIHDALSAMAVRASIGIASGRAFCGAYGSMQRRQYTIVGPVINLASRMTQPAAGGILCDEATVRGAQARIHFDPPTPVLIKGRPEPLAVFRPQGRVQEAPGAVAGFVGREAERRLLHARVDAGAGGVVGIIGEAGIGKSFLLHDAIAYARARGVRVISSAGDAVERSTTYYAWREILARLLGPAAAPADLRTKVQQALSADETLLPWTPLLNAVLPFGFDENDVTRYMESEARTDSIQAMVALLLEQAQREQPILIVIDDLHWLDSTSLALLLGVALRVPNLLIVFAMRPPEEIGTASLQRIASWPGAELLVLEPLSSTDSLALVRQRLGVQVVPDKLARFIQGRAEGHPFYTEELTLALREAGLITVENGVCRVVADSLESANFPDSVHGVVTSRIDRLQPIEQLALKTASVIGRLFPCDVLTDVYPVDQDKPRIPEALHAFERANLARLATPDPHMTYLFRHVITQDIAYNSLLFAQRRQLHERIAKWYERQHPDNLAVFYPLLAYHWDRAGVADKAVEYLEKAGVEALSAFSSEECAQFFQRVQEIAQEHPELTDVHRRAEWERYLGDAFQHMTDYQRSRVHFHAALRLIGRPWPEGRPRMLIALLHEILRQTLHRLAPSRFVGSAHGTRERDLRNAAVTYRGLVEIAFFQGDTLGTLYASVAGLNCGERSRQYTAMSTGAGALAYVGSLVGMSRLGRFYLRLGTRYAKEGLNLTDIAYVDGIQAGLTEVSSMRWPAAEAAFLRGAAGLKRVGYRLRWENVMGGYGFVLQLTGRFTQAMQAFDQVYESARANRIQNVIIARNGQLGTGLITGDYRSEWVDELAALISPRSPMTEATTAYGLIAQARLRAGDIEEAWRALELGLQVMRNHPPDTYYGLTGFANIATTYLEIWERKQSPVSARELGARVKESCAMLRSYSRFLRMGRARAALCTGWYDALRGRHQRAIRHFYRGLASARKARMPYDEALLHYQLARWLPAADPRKAQHLTECTDRFRALGAQPDLQRALAK